VAGHSKWANIQHRKKAQDARRGKLFTRLIREITVAAKTGGSDLDANPTLRTAVDKARAQSVPKDAIERAVKRGAGELDGADYEEIRYEGYGPAGVAFIVDCLSDNRNRTVAEVRHAFSKGGGNLGQSGSVAYLFDNVGVLLYSPEHDEDRVMEAALEAGALVLAIAVGASHVSPPSCESVRYTVNRPRSPLFARKCRTSQYMQVSTRWNW